MFYISSIHGSLPVPEILSGDLQGQNYFHSNSKIYIICLFHCIEICIDGAEAMMGEIAGALPQNKAEAPNSTSSHSKFKKRNNKNFHLRMFLMK